MDCISLVSTSAVRIHGHLHVTPVESQTGGHMQKLGFCAGNVLMQ